MAGRLGIDPGAAGAAVLLHSTARVLAFRLAVASYASLFGHFWDMLAALYAIWFFDRLPRPRYGAGFAFLVAVSILSYAGSVLTLGIFVPILSLAVLFSRRTSPHRGTAAALAAYSLLGALAAAGIFYLQYVPELLGSGEAASSTSGTGLSSLVEQRLTPFAAAAMAFYRLQLFYAWPYAALGIALLAWFFWKRGEGLHPAAVPFAVAASGTYLGMNFLRAGLGSTHIFQFSKDDLVVLPLIALLLGRFLRALWERGALARALAVAIVVGWVAFGYFSLARDVERRFLRPEYPSAGAPPPSSAASLLARAEGFRTRKRRDCPRLASLDRARDRRARRAALRHPPGSEER
jgi:hypothetical protein